MIRQPINRRRFLLAAALLSPVALVADAKWIEPNWLKVRRLCLAQGVPTHRFIHFTDLHHKGNRAYGLETVRIINSLSPDFVCFTGDLVEDATYLPEALEILSGIRAPLYGVPGNHDYWSRSPFDVIARAFAATGGAWLMDEQRTVDGKLNVIGMTCHNTRLIPPAPKPDQKNILLLHYPAWVKNLGDHRFDVMLAGHSHGGQIRIPFYGAIMVPYGVDEFEVGLFQTSNGPLYVNPGIGWFITPLRFNCRPEITLVEI